MVTKSLPIFLFVISMLIYFYRKPIKIDSIFFTKKQPQSIQASVVVWRSPAVLLFGSFDLKQLYRHIV